MAKKYPYIVESRVGGIDVDQGMAIELVFKNGKKRVVRCGKVLHSYKKVKTVEAGEEYWRHSKADRRMRFRGLTFKQVESADFVISPGENFWRWSRGAANQCEMIYAVADSTTHRIVFGGELKEGILIVYCFSIPP